MPHRTHVSAATSRTPLATTALIVVALGACIAVPWQISSLVRQVALEELSARSVHTLNLIVENLRGELAKFRTQPELISRSIDLQKVLDPSRSQDDVNATNQALAEINRVIGALDTYVMDTTGLTVAASNWASTRPFVGENFKYRPYFQEAMQGRLGRYFALGTTSGERGYYFAYPVHKQNEIVGAVVIKIRVGQLEMGWRTRDSEVAVVDADGIVFLSTAPAWQFRPFEPLSATRKATVESERRYSGWSLEPIGWRPIQRRYGAATLVHISGSPESRAQPEHEPTEYLVLDRAMQDAGWSVRLFTRTETVSAQVNLALLIAFLTITSLVLAIANLLQRRRRIADRLAFETATRADLEVKVRERTSALQTANQRLLAEIEERRRAELELHQTQDELVQASKLAALGQLSAGLSHELNQPLTAIKTFAENAVAFIGRGDAETAARNMGRIAELTQRMARIVSNLRTYARKEAIAPRPTLLIAAIEGALELLEQRIAALGVGVSVTAPDRGVRVQAGDVRLQQVFVNLISNALDAVASVPDRRISIAVIDGPDTCQIEVTDSGPGIAKEAVNRLFDPFFTTKDVGQGTGLGLSITVGLISQFGGSISADNVESSGARFVVRLPKAAQERSHAA